MYSVSLFQSSLVSVSSKRAKREMRSTPARRKLDAQQHPRGRRLSRSFDYHSVPGQHVSLFSFEKATILQTSFRLREATVGNMSAFSGYTLEGHCRCPFHRLRVESQWTEALSVKEKSHFQTKTDMC